MTGGRRTADFDNEPRTVGELMDVRPPGCRFRLKDEGKPYPRSSCNVCGRNITTGLGRRCHHEFIAGVEPVGPKYGFSDEEQAALLKRPEIMDDFLRYSQKHGFEKAVEHVRLAYMTTYLDPQIDKLREMASQVVENFAPPFPETVAAALNGAADTLMLHQRRPVSELHRMPFGPHQDGSDTRWVILWGPSGYNGLPWRCAVGRRAPPDAKFAGRFVRHDGECFTDDGADATHFSELPRF